MVFGPLGGNIVCLRADIGLNMGKMQFIAISTWNYLSSLAVLCPGLDSPWRLVWTHIIVFGPEGGNVVCLRADIGLYEGKRKHVAIRTWEHFSSCRVLCPGLDSPWS